MSLGMSKEMLVETNSSIQKGLTQKMQPNDMDGSGDPLISAKGVHTANLVHTGNSTN